MKCESLFSGKIIQIVLKFRQLKFLPNMLSVNKLISYHTIPYYEGLCVLDIVF